MVKKLLFVGFLLVISFFPQKAIADDGWQIDTFHADIAIEKSGAVVVKETIAAQFQDQKHGIYRDIPYVYNDKGEKYYTEVIVRTVLQDGKNATYQVFNNGSSYRLKIGDADKTLSGKHEYVIIYRVKGILRGFPDHDELYWNVTGDQWGVIMNSATAEVRLPASGVLLTACFQGVSGSGESCNTQKGNDLAVFSTTRLLGSQEQMTIALLYKKGMVPLLVATRPKTFTEQLLTPTPLFLFFSMCVIGFFWGYKVWWQKGRDEKSSSDTIVVEYTSPEELTPAEIGVLMDEKADTLDVTATIIDLTTRGYLTITEIAKKWLFGKTDYQLNRKKADDKNLRSYEKELLKRLFSDGDEVLVSDLKNTFYKDLAAVKKLLYQDVVNKKLFATNPESVRTNYLGVGIVLIVLGSISTSSAASAQWVLPSVVGGGVVVWGVLILILSRMMPKRTAYGRELYRRIKGYRLFISEAETYRQRFFEQKNLFNEVLPYAIVFGLTKKFADAMKTIGLKNVQPVGYYGVVPFNSSSFVSNVSDFSNSFSSAAASAPSSSGSSGSSGGGFGGGGGGSW